MAERTIKHAQLLAELEWRYSEQAYSDTELAEIYGVNRSTIYKARRTLEDMDLPLYEESHGRYRLDPNFRLTNVRLTVQETLALYLGGRRLQQQTRTGQAHVATALQKLARALRKPMMEEMIRAAEVVLEQEQDTRQVDIMDSLVEGWMTRRKVRIQHHRPGGKVRTYTVSPYQLEPSVWGDGVYLIGFSDYHDRVATFKVARIERATVTMDPFSIPDDFDSHELLEHAWGIWADGEPVTVRLRFSAAAAPRVRESVWHPSQTILDEASGCCIWQAKIAGTRELEPWVRSWGAAVEVLEPAELREEVVRELQAALKSYSEMNEGRNS